MKVIDLLNKIANGEEVPKKIKFRNVIWNYERRRDTDFYNYQRAGDYLSRAYFLDNILNDEVEIIEEEKKIPEKLEDYSLDEKGKYPIKPTIYESILKDKINEIIDVLEMLNDKIK